MNYETAVEDKRPVVEELRCGGCKHPNSSIAKFCASCGHGLFERCPECQEPVRLVAKFCNGCGCDLGASLASRRGEMEDRIQRAIQLAKVNSFAEAVYLIRPVASEKDYRFADLADAADRAIQKIESIGQQVTARVEQLKAAATAALESGDRGSAISLLEQVPETLLDRDSQRLLDECRAFLEETAEAKSALKAALAVKDWKDSAGLLDRLMALHPDNAQYRKLATDVAKRVLSDAEQLFNTHRYADAVESLEYIGASLRDEEYESFRRRCEDGVWLEKQIADEPFVTPTLGKLAVLLAKHSPDNRKGAELASKILASLKEQAKLGTKTPPYWTGPRESTLGGEIKFLPVPTSFAVPLPEAIGINPSRFCTAIGLALQGIGESKFNGKMNEVKGFFEKLPFGKKVIEAWGIDIGASAIRAVCLKKDKDTITLSDAKYIEYPTSNNVVLPSEVLLRSRESIQKLVSEVDFTKASVWVNFPSRDSLPRFVNLPPVDDKKAKALLEKEAEGQFPVDLDQLACLQYLCPIANNIEGRPSAIVAARKATVSQRVDFLAAAGLKITGMQCDAIAIANFFHRELNDALNISDEETKLPTLAIVDSGASCTTLILLHKEGFWFRTIDIGGSDMTSLLARSTKQVASEAEMLKRDPSKLTSPSIQYVPIEEKQLVVAERLKQLVDMAQKALPSAKIVETRLVGGLAHSYGFARRMSKRAPTK